MAKKPNRSTRPKPRVTPSEQSRIDARNALNRAVRREREIQRLSKQLTRAVASANADLENMVRGYAAAQGFELVAVDQQRAVGE